MQIFIRSNPGYLLSRSGIIFLILILLSATSSAAIEVGEVRYSRGVLTGQFEGENARLKGKGQSIGQGETLSTGQNSFAIIMLNDGTRMTLRPNTVFKVDQLNTNAGEENALLSLIKGGFRAITGSIAKAFGGAFKINTAVATIGIRGTEFDARICTATDCEQENRQLAADSPADPVLKPEMIARVIRLRGNARATSQDGKARALRVGAPIFEQDRLNTGISTFLVVAFNDESRMTLTSNSELVIREHRYQPDKPAENSALLDFIRGGLRLISGLIRMLIVFRHPLPPSVFVAPGSTCYALANVGRVAIQAFMRESGMVRLSLKPKKVSCYWTLIKRLLCPMPRANHSWYRIFPPHCSRWKRHRDPIKSRLTQTGLVLSTLVTKSRRVFM